MEYGKIELRNSTANKLVETDSNNILKGDRDISSTSSGNANDILDRTGVEAVIPATQPATHASTHENAGGDEMSVAGLSGLLADQQTPVSHNNTYHSETYIEATDVTYENLDTNGDIGTTASTVAAGNDSRFLTTDEAAGVAGSTTPITGSNPAVSVADLSPAINTNNMVWVEDQKATTTAGGGCVAATQNIRTLNTVVLNNIGASLSSNQITLGSGSYYAEFSAPAVSPSTNINLHRLRLRDTTNIVTVVLGSNTHSGSQFGNDGQNVAIGSGIFTLAGSANLELQHYTSTTRATDGLGYAVSDGAIEKFSVIKIWEI